jgi:hypothetical protein
MSFRKELALMTDPTPAAQTSEPRTAAGRRLHARIFGLSDRMPDGAELDNLILAIEAEAAALPAAPAELERRDIDLIYMDGYLAGRDAPDWRDDDHVLRLAERYAAAYAEGEPE